MPAESSAAPEHGVAAPATTFAALGVPAALVGVLDDQGITVPFPVQVATLPDGLAGRDILGRAQTGSGKTLGFSLPLVTLVLWLPDVYILVNGQPAKAVGFLFAMHLAIALVTYNALVRLAPVRAPSRTAGHRVQPAGR